MTEPTDDPPDDLPPEIVEALEGSTDEQLREIIHYAQQLVREHRPLTDDIEPREGEEILEVVEHGSYTTVVVERPEESGEARGPFAYRVEWEPGFEDAEGQFRWHYLGKVDREEVRE